MTWLVVRASLWLEICAILPFLSSSTFNLITVFPPPQATAGLLAVLAYVQVNGWVHSG